MRLFIDNRCGVPIRCIVTVTADAEQYRVFFVGANGHRTDMKGKPVPMQGKEIADVIVPSHGMRQRMAIAEVKFPGKSILVYDHFGSKWRSKRDKGNNIVVTVEGLVN